jgi:ribosome-binding protein aMBF1 (putative translation factor)
MKLSDMKTAEEVLARDLEQDPKFAEEWERTALARSLANQVLAYRVEQGLSQAELGRILGMSQPAVARLEAGDHEPTLKTLRRISHGLGIRFHIDVESDAVTLESELVAASD